MPAAGRAGRAGNFLASRFLAGADFIYNDGSTAAKFFVYNLAQA
jgi:hypothetical protein